MLCRQASRALDWTGNSWTVERIYPTASGARSGRSVTRPKAQNPIVVVTTYNAQGAKLTQTLPCFEGGTRSSAHGPTTRTGA